MIGPRRVAVVAAVLLVLLAGWWWGTPGPPSSQEAFRCVMATYSAARSRDLARIESIETLLNRLSVRDEEAEPIRAMLEVARRGEWESAADQAYRWMQHQRRRATPGG